MPTEHAHRVAPRALIKLFAGRGSFRLAQLAANVALLPLWGEATYGVYASAVATFSFLIALLQSGPEKTVLKLLPRAPLSGPTIVRALTMILWCLPIPVLLAFAVTIAISGTAAVSIYVGVAAMAVGSGTLLLVAGLHRVTGRLHYDHRSAAIMGVLQIVMLGLVLLGLQPLGYLIIYVSAQTVVNTFLLVKLGRPSMEIRRRPGFLRRVIWTSVFLGSPEICLYLISGVLVTYLAASRWSGQAGQLIAVTMVWTAGLTLVMYAMRIYTPLTSVRLLGNAARGRALAARMSRWTIGYAVVWVAAMAVVLNATDILKFAESPHAFILWAILLFSRTPTDMLGLAAGFLLENSDAKATRISGLAALGSLVVAATTGAFLVPTYGGVGLLVATAIGEIGQASVVVAMLRRDSGPARNLGPNRRVGTA